MVKGSGIEVLIETAKRLLLLRGPSIQRHCLLKYERRRFVPCQYRHRQPTSSGLEVE
jgi:hypothetical protein